jgi:hypothetical protein
MDVGSHINALRNEARKLASTVSNPVVRLGYEKMIKAALVQVSDGLKGEQQDEIGSSADSRKLVMASSTETSTIQNRTWYQSSCNTSPFGQLFITSKFSESSSNIKTENTDDEETQHRIETTLRLHPSRWLQICGITYGVQIAFSKSFQGLDCRLKTYRAVPNDSPIFELCGKGDVDGVRRLFDERRASPWDTDSEGHTPLHVKLLP